MLSKKTKYAFHALLYLAKNASNDNPALIVEIAQETSAPRKFLENILLELKNGGFLASKKGKGGGYFLLKSPKDINLVQIIRLLDGAIALLPCASLNYYQPCEECKDENICGIRDIFIEIRNKTLEILGGNTLWDILQKEERKELGVSNQVSGKIQN